MDRPRALGFVEAIVVTLFYLRRNNPRAVQTELFGCSRPTIWRYITTLEPVVSVCLDPSKPPSRSKPNARPYW